MNVESLNGGVVLPVLELRAEVRRHCLCSILPSATIFQDSCHDVLQFSITVGCITTKGAAVGP